MDGLILAIEECDYVNEVVCKPANVLELFEFQPLFGDINRTVFLIALAALDCCRRSLLRVSQTAA